jgi:pyruvate ferredoxin oxidoreductase gamma subunit
MQLLQLRIQGRGGQGAQMAGEVLAHAFFKQGKFVQAYSTYGGARRGTPVSTFIRVDDEFIRHRCDIEEPDAIVVFDATLLGPALLQGAGPETAILVNSTRPVEELGVPGGYRIATIDGISIASRNGLGRIVNSAVLGAFAALVGQPDLEVLLETVEEVSPAKTAENVAAAREGHEAIASRVGSGV